MDCDSFLKKFDTHDYIGFLENIRNWKVYMISVDGFL